VRLEKNHEAFAKPKIVERIVQCIEECDKLIADEADSEEI
jgi:hypothetical protein